MAAGRLVAVLLAGAAGGASAGASIRSCGSQLDRLQSVSVGFSPDPFNKGAPITLSVSGVLDGPLTGGSIVMDLNIRAFLVLEKVVRTTAPFTLAPGLPGGNNQLVVGPVALPPRISQSEELNGKVSLFDEAGKPVACIELNVRGPGMAAEAAQVQAREVGVAASCAKPGDHLKNLSASSSGGVFKMAGTLDEDVAKMSVDVDVTVKASPLTVPIKMTVPVAFSPGLKKGPVSATFGPATAPGQRAELGMTAEGSVSVKDAAGEEIACVEISPGGLEQPSLVV